MLMMDMPYPYTTMTFFGTNNMLGLIYNTLLITAAISIAMLPPFKNYFNFWVLVAELILMGNFIGMMAIPFTNTAMHLPPNNAILVSVLHLITMVVILALARPRDEERPVNTGEKGGYDPWPIVLRYLGTNFVRGGRYGNSGAHVNAYQRPSTGQVLYVNRDTPLFVGDKKGPDPEDIPVGDVEEKPVQDKGKHVAGLVGNIAALNPVDVLEDDFADHLIMKMSMITVRYFEYSMTAGLFLVSVLLALYPTANVYLYHIVFQVRQQHAHSSMTHGRLTSPPKRTGHDDVQPGCNPSLQGDRGSHQGLWSSPFRQWWQGLGEGKHPGHVRHVAPIRAGHDSSFLHLLLPLVALPLLPCGCPPDLVWGIGGTRRGSGGHCNCDLHVLCVCRRWLRLHLLHYLQAVRARDLWHRKVQKRGGFDEAAAHCIRATQLGQVDHSQCRGHRSADPDRDLTQIGRLGVNKTRGTYLTYPHCPDANTNRPVASGLYRGLNPPPILTENRRNSVEVQTCNTRASSPIHIAGASVYSVRKTSAATMDVAHPPAVRSMNLASVRSTEMYLAIGPPPPPCGCRYCFGGGRVFMAGVRTQRQGSTGGTLSALLMGVWGGFYHFCWGMFIWGTANPCGEENETYKGLYLRHRDIDSFIREMPGKPVKVEHAGPEVGRVLHAWKNKSNGLDCILEVNREGSVDGSVIASLVNERCAKDLSLGYRVR